MLDFKRIGGDITSAPLNDNFRRLRNDISIANTNLVFPETDAIVPTIDDMKKIENPQNAQTCYVVSSGELYRFSKHDNEWHKIADFGQTFRQGFLNSGAVILEDYIKLEGKSGLELKTPNMLVYFKNKKGDDRYLKGMYLIEETVINTSTFLDGVGTYSVYVDGSTVDVNPAIKVIKGLPMNDNPDVIYLGVFLVGKDKKIHPGFIYTMPNMAYTADRSIFLLNRGLSKGLALAPGKSGKQVSRFEGYYYDEGINFPIGKTDNYPIDNDNGSSYNIKRFEPLSPVDKIYYAAPAEQPLEQEITLTDGLIIDKYWDKKENKLKPVGESMYTVQQQVMTPNGQTVIFYGENLYNSKEDAESNINDVYGIPDGFPHVEITRIIVRNSGNSFSSANPDDCSFYSLGKLTQVGTMSPQFADDEFEIYSGQQDDTTPSRVAFSLNDLQKDNYDRLFKLTIGKFNTIRHRFALDHKYITDTNIPTETPTTEETRFYEGEGYLIADNADLEFLRSRVDDIEEEIWSKEKAGSQAYAQSVRYRLFKNEEHLREIDETLARHDARLTWLENNKVNKGTKINGYTLGDSLGKEEIKEFAIKTGDIEENKGLGDKANLWYTEERVSNNKDVVASRAHRNTVSQNDAASGHTKINPHNLSTDDITLLQGTQKIFVTPEEERRIRSDKLPEDTKQALADLDAKNIDSIKVDKIDGKPDASTGTITEVGKVKGLRFYEDGVNLSLSSDKNTLIVECKGQMDEEKVMFRNTYAQQSVLQPETLSGYVDKALKSTISDGITGIETAGPNQYYGTDANSVPGIYNLKKYVSSADSGSFTDIDQVVFVPIDGSVQEKHLEPNLRNKINNNYHKIYNSGKISSNEINEFNFGNNLEVVVSGHKATINATGSGSGSGVSKFANLDDVDVVYTGNKGKSLIVNEAENGIVIADLPSFENYMLKTVYVDSTDITKVKKARFADKATNADTATNATKVNGKAVDDSKIDTGSLWTASKIISNTSSQIDKESVKTYSGTGVPASSLGKNGDLYIML